MEFTKKTVRVPTVAWLSLIAGITAAVCCLAALLLSLFAAETAPTVLLCLRIALAVLALAAIVLGGMGLSQSSQREFFSRKGRALSKAALILGVAALLVWIVFIYAAPAFSKAG